MCASCGRWDPAGRKRRPREGDVRLNETRHVDLLAPKSVDKGFVQFHKVLFVKMRLKLFSLGCAKVYYFFTARTLRRIFLKNLKKYLRFVGPASPRAFFCRMESFGLRFWPLLCSDECGPGSGRHRQRRARRTSAAADSSRPRYVRLRCGGIRPGGLERASALVPPQFLPGRVACCLPGRVYVADLAGLPGRMGAVLPDRTFAVLRGGCTPFCRERTLTVLSDRAH